MFISTGLAIWLLERTGSKIIINRISLIEKIIFSKKVWNAAAEDADCVDPGIVPCNASSKWNGCQSEGTFLIEGCKKRVTCTLSYRENGCDDGKFFDEKYKKCVKYPQDSQCPQQTPPSNPAPRTDINCDGKYHVVPGTNCKSFYSCSYVRDSYPYGCWTGEVLIK
jgi:hypothetical protein